MFYIPFVIYRSLCISQFADITSYALNWHYSWSEYPCLSPQKSRGEGGAAGVRQQGLWRKFNHLWLHLESHFRAAVMSILKIESC